MDIFPYKDKIVSSLKPVHVAMVAISTPAFFILEATWHKPSARPSAFPYAIPSAFPSARPSILPSSLEVWIASFWMLMSSRWRM